ncbi:MAG: hypothetical protein DCF25_20345 [Leptolyngbya foveolarum]|uniref:Uncharacterized protein n=1 Tax=Leptolyngbya foveolarum TaxID=47253 RepID=A0A2W4TNH7_9CYAN|nr:MAG: hypothetical protein DCF25_20345 [Leptolyngbya foveolarum]
MHNDYKALPDLDAIARNLIALDLAHLTPEESTAYEQELSAIASINEALEITVEALKGHSPQFWQRLHPLLSDAAALLRTRSPRSSTSTPNAASPPPSAPSNARLP